MRGWAEKFFAKMNISTFLAAAAANSASLTLIKSFQAGMHGHFLRLPRREPIW